MTAEEAPNTDLVIAIDLGGTNLRAAAIDRIGKIHRHVKRLTPRDGDPANLVSAIVAAVRECAAGVDQTPIRAVAVAIPGTVHHTEGTVMNAPNLPWLNGFALTAALQTDLSSTVMIENDANAAAVGEMWQGAARDARSIICVTLGTGVGGGVILDGELWRGIDGTSGEVGHVGVVYDGPPCGCGSRGCVEQFASATAIVRMTRELLPEYPDSTLKAISPLTAEAVYRQGISGDELAREVYRRAGTYLGMGLASLVNVLNPELIVIAGGVAESWGLFIPSVRAEIDARAFPEPARRVQLVPAACGDDAGLLGAAYLAFKKIDA
jgi:glucokinase